MNQINPHKSPNTDTEHIYYNVNISNQTDAPINASFSETRTASILDNSSDYQLSIIRFSVPVKNIPLMILPPSLNYSITYSFDGLDATTYIAWIPNSNNPQKQYYIYNPQEFIDAVNSALSNGFDSIKVLKPAFPATIAPYFVIDGDLVNFCAQTTMTNQLYFNKLLKNMFATLNFIENYNGNETNPKYYQIVIKDNGNNTLPTAPPQYKMISSSSILPLWSDFKALIMATSMPVNSELVGAQNNIKRIVLTDFEADITDKTPLRYYPQGPLRYYDMISKIPLMTVDLGLYWESSRTGSIYPIILEKGDNCTIKIMFEHKKTRNDYITY